MKTLRFLMVALAWPTGSLAQEAPPSGFAEAELERSRACVGSLSRLAALDASLEPYALRIQRIRALAGAVALEDSTEVGPFDAADSLEVAVRRWFAEDGRMALEYVTDSSEVVLEERRAAREAIRQALTGGLQEVQAQAQEHLVEAPQLNAAAQPCQGSIFVRSAVLEACAGVDSPLCGPAASSETVESFRFVDAPEDLWDIEEMRPWSQPGPLVGNPDGSLSGARTAAQLRRGNLMLSVALSPIIRERSELDDEQIVEFEANLDSLGMVFDHPRFVMAPAIEVQASLLGPVGGATHYLLHFGEVAEPDVLWTMPVGEPGRVQATFPAPAGALARLQAGDPLTLTAVRIPDGEDPQAEAVFVLPLLNVAQSASVTALLGYMGGGGLSETLRSLIPPG